VTEVFKSIVEPLQSSANVKSVFGDAIPAQGKTIIPVARVGYGFGGGGGKGGRHETSGDGAGGGGGVIAIPLGVFEITDTRTRFIPLHEKRKVAAGALIGLCLGILCARRWNRAGAAAVRIA
jgi:uncharacterized spore protein YtfJ